MKKTKKSIIYCIFLLLFVQFNSSLAIVNLGINMLENSNFAEIKGKRIALLTNFSGRDNTGKLTTEILALSKEVELKLILTPEHGFYGVKAAGESVSNSEYWGIPILSLYGSTKLIPSNYADDFDIIIVDIQDIGVRAYTFISTLYYVMQSAVNLDKEIYILDRPNPLGGIIVDGNLLEEDYKSFIGIVPVTYLHGLTIGEIASMIIGEGWLGKNAKENACKLSIIKMDGWERWMQWEDTGLMWIPTSPNIPSVDAIRGAAMLGWIGELSLFSVGIGTNLPFQYFGTPDINSNFYSILDNFELNGSQIIQTDFMPVYGKYANQHCKGFLLRFEKNNNFTPFSNGIELIITLRNLYPKLFIEKNIELSKKQMFKKATGTSKLYDLIFEGGSDDSIRKAAYNGVMDFFKLRKKYLLY
ncbi:MAG: hypothetical protein A2X64_06665 [Ignavibacteria bacterium GWF2_33_9]|nr:MAG: hypothetical protein A2X64_06665 [Ignavibacteria bacterium GWF2_33_9]